MTSTGSAERYEAGHVAGAGSYKCRDCGLRIGLEALEEMPRCPACDGESFRRAPLFQATQALAAPSVPERPASAPRPVPSWLVETRSALADGGRYLAFDDGEEVRVVPLPVGWSRIGRSTASDIRLNDPTVSRRHAMIVRTASGHVRILDDRSLNGVQLNASRVEWGTLADGDELAIGRFRLYLVALDPAGSREGELSLAD